MSDEQEEPVEDQGDLADDDEADPETPETEEEQPEAEAEEGANSAPVETEQKVDRDGLTAERRDLVNKVRKRALDLGYPRMFEEAAREKLPGMEAALNRKAEVRDAKAEARKELLKQYPTHRGPGDKEK